MFKRFSIGAAILVVFALLVSIGQTGQAPGTSDETPRSIRQVQYQAPHTGPMGG